MVLSHLNVRLRHAITYSTYRPIYFLEEEEMSFPTALNSKLKREAGQNTDSFKTNNIIFLRFFSDNSNFNTP